MPLRGPHREARSPRPEMGPRADGGETRAGSAAYGLQWLPWVSGGPGHHSDGLRDLDGPWADRHLPTMNVRLSHATVIPTGQGARRGQAAPCCRARQPRRHPHRGHGGPPAHRRARPGRRRDRAGRAQCRRADDVTDDGEIRGVAEVERLAGHHLFVPDFTPVLTLPTRPEVPVTIDPKTNYWRLSKCERDHRDDHRHDPADGRGGQGRRLPARRHDRQHGRHHRRREGGREQHPQPPRARRLRRRLGRRQLPRLPVGTGINSYAFQHQLSPTTTTCQRRRGDLDRGRPRRAATCPRASSSRCTSSRPTPAIGWRADSKRIVVWFGDAPGHDPICAGSDRARRRDHRGLRDRRPRRRPPSPSSRSAPTTGTAGALDDDPNADARRLRRPAPPAARPGRPPGSPPRPAAATRPGSTPTRSSRRWARSSPPRWRRPATSASCRPATPRSSSSRSPRPAATDRWPATWSTSSPSR